MGSFILYNRFGVFYAWNKIYTWSRTSSYGELFYDGTLDSGVFLLFLVKKVLRIIDGCFKGSFDNSCI